jgi:phosphate transport system substrate-binding protein
MHKERAAAVFSVLVTNDNQQLESKGTATLVDSERGIFLTAAHVVHFYRDLPIFVSQKIRGQNSTRVYQVHVFPTISATDNWKNEDLALLQAEQWNKPAQLLAFPFRIDAVDEYIKGFFIGHAEDMSNSVFGDFSITFGDDGSNEMKFTGTVFPHASGAMLLDGQGRAFALILSEAKVQNSLVSELKISQIRRILWESTTFSAFPLRLVLDKLKAIPPSSAAQELISELTRNGNDDQFQFGLQRTALNAIDTIHLTDTIVSAGVWQQLLDQAALDGILLEMMPVVQAACTHRYFAKHYSEHFDNSRAAMPAPEQKPAMNAPNSLATPIVKVENAATAPKKPELSSSTEPLRTFDNVPPDKAKDAGMLFLGEALATKRATKLTNVQARLALTLLQRAADKPEIRRAIESPARNRDYAALMANIALAQDLLGDKEAARKSILLADKLGGSPAAYGLAAQYAAAENDPVAAAGLYARSYAMLSNEDPDGHLRASVVSDYDGLTATEPSIRGTTIEKFNIRTVAGRDSGRWYALATPLSAGNVKVADISGVGASGAFPIYSRWADSYKEATGIGLNYQSIGSGAGIKQIEGKTVTFGASDRPLNADQLQKAGLIQFPTLLGGIVPAININGIEPGALVLDGPTLARIFAGEIKRWDDEAIKRLNPLLKPPPLAITVVHRADGNGATFIFTNYLSKVNGDWKSKIGSNVVVEWPVGVSAKGNSGVVETVKNINGAIGYVEYAYAKQNRLTYTRLVNRDGMVVSPTVEAFKAAAAGGDWAYDPDFTTLLTDQAGTESWPIVGATFVLFKKHPQDADAAGKTLKFFDWAYTNGDKIAEELLYVPMPERVVESVKKTWATEIKDPSGMPVFTAIK